MGLFYNPNLPRVYELSKELGILDFIGNLPDGLATYLGENGTTLSGGQRQRLAIARALYRNPQILIFDEATSSLDYISQKSVQNTIENWFSEEKILISITHQLASVVEYDNIIVFDNGHIVGNGTHKELLEQNIHYQKLCNKN